MIRMIQLVTERIEGRVAILTLDAPERLNAISLDMREAVIAALQRRFLDDECGALVLTGAGGNFSAGGDIKGERPAPEAMARALRHKLGRLQEMVRLIASSPKPVVAAVDGKAFGAGMSLAVVCDVLVATETAQFCAAFGKVGLLPDAGILYTLPRRVGAARAQQLLLSGRTVEAREACEMGLADHVVPAADLLARACAEAQRLAAIAPLSFAAIKSLGNGGCATLEEAFAAEMRLQPGLAMSDDYSEARAAFADKRKPVFRGR
jgi:2-(1,2-epoxy-1,2-dihydrophenyl)acetyl-CoA isomerase